MARVSVSGARPGIESPRLVALAAIAVAAGVSLALNLPGHMSYDSVLQLAQARSGVYNNWHPPVMAWLLGVFDAVVRGTALFVLFNTLLIYGALAVLVCASPKTSWAAAPLLALWAMIPDGLIYPGIVWKDVLFAATATAGFAGLAIAARLWARPRWRLTLVAASFLLLALAGLSRQNGLVILPPAAIACGWMAVQQGGPKPLRSAAAYTLLPLVGAALVMVSANAALQTRSDGEPSQAYQLEDLETYDLAAALQSRPSLKLHRLSRSHPRLARLLRARAAPAYTPVRLDPISGMADVQHALFNTPMRTMSAEWADLVLHHPGLYLKIRARDFFWVFLTPRIDVCVPFFDGVSGPQPWVSRLGLVNRERPQDVALKDWGLPWSHTPLSSHGLYAALSVLVLGLTLRRRRRADLAVAGLQAAALAFTATFFIISVACDYRYLYFLDLAAVAGALYVAADPGGLRLRRRPPAAP